MSHRRGKRGKRARSPGGSPSISALASMIDGQLAAAQQEHAELVDLRYRSKVPDLATLEKVIDHHFEALESLPEIKHQLDAWLKEELTEKQRAQVQSLIAQVSVYDGLLYEILALAQALKKDKTDELSEKAPDGLQASQPPSHKPPAGEPEGVTRSKKEPLVPNEPNRGKTMKYGIPKHLDSALEILTRFRLHILVGVAALALMVTVTQVFFQLEPEEQAIVLRLGKPLEETFSAGLHLKIPFIDQVHRAPVHRQQRLEFGFRTDIDLPKENQAYESLMLTGDLMLVHVRWSLVYKIEGIHAWLFEVKGRESTIRDISMAVMRQIVGDYSLDEILTTKQLEVATLAHETTQSALREKVPTGVVITEVAIKSADVPEAAREAFDDLTRTLAKVQGELADAKAEQDNAIGRARKLKNETIGLAENQRAKVIENARGEAAAFLGKVVEYDRAPEITRQWMYLRTMTMVLENLDEKLIIEEGEGQSISKHLPLRDFVTSGAGGSQ